VRLPGVDLIKWLAARTLSIALLYAQEIQTGHGTQSLPSIISILAVTRGIAFLIAPDQVVKPAE
jgi:hypothetical protein